MFQSTDYIGRASHRPTGETNGDAGSLLRGSSSSMQEQRHGAVTIADDERLQQVLVPIILIEAVVRIRCVLLITQAVPSCIQTRRCERLAKAFEDICRV